MAKKKQMSATDLAKLCQSLNVPDEAFDGDLRDAADDAAELIFETVKGQDWDEKFQFLMDHGFQPGRLQQLIEEYANTGGNPL
jgi:hypothetical protein